MKHVIDIDSQAVVYIQEKGGTVTVRLSPRHGCCGGSANIVVAEAGHPNDPKHLQRYVQDGITLYIAPELANENLHIGVDGWWKLRRLYVDGLPLQPGHTNRQKR
ncbi:MAG: hypothetical protein EA345_15745 [Halomonas sp.]|nr:MAG: hypothetical protein EA345_15745 [Halomonas sp.]